MLINELGVASTPDGSREQGDARLQRLISAAVPGARIARVVSLGTDTVTRGVTLKGAGYGAPLRVELDCGGELRSVVLHTATANAFGHDRRSDRAAAVLLAADTYDSIDGHVRVLDVGAFRGDEDVISLRDSGDFYVLTEWAEGEPYAADLRRLAQSGNVTAHDVARVDQLAAYLARLHAEHVDQPHARARALRDLLGSGEGIFGIVDSYPAGTPAAPAHRLRAIEVLCADWRWRLKDIPRPLSRIHGDFHPFNVLFNERGGLVLLDTSRGSCGEPADDVSSMALNYVFFALESPELWRTALSRLWQRFWTKYLELSQDRGVLEVAAPFLAWRGLVLASPVWYPLLSAAARDRLLGFVETSLEAESFDPRTADEVFA